MAFLAGWPTWIVEYICWLMVHHISQIWDSVSGNIGYTELRSTVEMAHRLVKLKYHHMYARPNSIQTN